MAFSTEFVMGAGGTVEMFEPAFTPNATSTRARLATQPVSTGQWLVAVNMTRNLFTTPSLWVNDVQTTGSNGSNARVSTTAVVSGPGTITIDGSAIGSGNAYIVRIG